MPCLPAIDRPRTLISIISPLSSLFVLMVSLLVQTVHAQSAVLAREPSAPPSPVLTPDKAVEEAVRNNLGLIAEQLNLNIADAEMITARLRPNPVFSFSSDHLDLLGSHFDRSNGGGPPEFSWRVDVPLERGHKRELRIEHAQIARDIAEAQLLDAVRKLVFDVRLAVVDLLLAKARLDLARDNLVTLEQLVKLNVVRVDAGAVAPLELTRSRVAMLQFNTNVKHAEIELAVAKTRLQNLLGRKPVDTFDILGDLQAKPARVELSEVESAALALRPDLQALERTNSLSRTNLKLQIAAGKVDYLAGAEYRRSQGINGKYNSMGFFISVPLPFFNRNQGEIARVAAEQEKIDGQLRALKADILAEVKKSHQELENARELLESIEGELLKPAQQARDTVTYTYRAGAATLMEFLDAQRAYSETMQSYYEAQAAYRRAAIQINAVTAREVTQ